MSIERYHMWKDEHNQPFIPVSLDGIDLLHDSMLNKGTAFTAEERAALGLPKTGAVTLYAPKGCEACAHQGYEGRVGVYELMIVDESIKRLIHDDSSDQVIEAAAFERAPTLFESGVALVRDGVTSTEEVLRITRSAGGADGGV